MILTQSSVIQSNSTFQMRCVPSIPGCLGAFELATNIAEMYPVSDIIVHRSSNALILSLHLVVFLIANFECAREGEKERYGKVKTDS